MKKILVVIFVCLFTLSICFAQVSSDKAAKKTAERCLKLSENYLLGGDVKSAISQAELGLSYDDTISDLYYIKAAAEKMNGKTVREVMELSQKAFDLNNWVGYNEKGNRILYADLLSDTGRWLESLEVLDKDPFVFSADAEAIRIKNYYRIGTDEYLAKARSKINSARRIYKGDIRFISLFYSFEITRCLLSGSDYEIESQVLEIADLLKAELKSYKNVSDEITCLSIFFMEGEEQVRAAKAFSANGSSDSLYPLVALKAGVLSERDAFEQFFEFADKEVPLEVLKYFASMLTEDDVKMSLYEHLNAYDGILYVDSDTDMQEELKIAYERGRPSSISFDFDNDGIEDLSGIFDFGELLSVSIKPLGTEIIYSPYPYAGRAVYSENGTVLIYEFSKNAAQISPIAFDIPDVLQVEDTENRFYVPFIKSNWNDRANLDYLSAATFVRASSSERKNAVVIYSRLDGNNVSAVFSVNGVSYATAEFENGLPLTRYVDYDGDGSFETTENFMVFQEENIDKFSDEDKNNVKMLFPPYDYSDKVYLESIVIDYDQDNFADFKESYKENGGKTTIWYSEDGKYQEYIRYPQSENSPLIEESVFVTGINNDVVTVETVDSLPSSVKINTLKYDVIPGSSEKFYWIGTEYETTDEIEILEQTQDIDLGTVVLVETSKALFRCIKVSDYTFAKSVEHEDIDAEQSDAEMDFSDEQISEPETEAEDIN